MALDDMEGAAAFDTAGMMSAGMAMLNPTPEVPAAPAVAAPVVEASPVAAPVTPDPASGEQPTLQTPAAATPKYLDLPDDQMVTLKVDGVEQVMTVAEAKKGFMLGAKFTKSQQEVRALERSLTDKLTHVQQLETRAQLADRYEQLLTNDRHLETYIRKAMPHLTLTQAAQAMANAAPVQSGAPAPASVPQFDPEGLATVGIAQQLTDQKIAQIEGQIGRKLGELERQQVASSEQLLAGIGKAIDARLTELAEQQEVAAIRTRIETSISGLTTAHPQLAKVPNLSGYIREEVAKLYPRSEAEVLEGIELVARNIASDLDAHYATQRQAAVVEKAKLVEQGVEAPNGSPAIQFQRPLTYRKPDGSFGWDNMEKAANARLNM